MTSKVIEQLLTASATAQRCQRNWDLSKNIDPSIVDCLKSIVKNSATKQNEEYYSVFFITNRSVIESLYQLSYDTINYIKNPQTLAQLLIVFDGRIPTTNRNLAVQHTPEELYVNQHQGIGIAAGQLTLAANMLGLKTGFCACFDNDNVSKLLNIKNPILMVGVGYPDESKLRRANHRESDGYAYFGSFEKPITITNIGESTTVETYTGELLPTAPIKSLILVAPCTQDIKNPGDISMIPDDISLKISDCLYRIGVKYNVEPLPYLKEWDHSKTQITLYWSLDNESSLDSFLKELKDDLKIILEPLNWTVI